MRARILAGIALALAATSASAVTRYVSLLGHHQAPYTNWYKAATNITIAVNALTSGDVLIISNGTHRMTAVAYVNVNATISGYGGAARTIVNGGGGAYPAFSGWNVRTVNIYDLTISNFGASAISASQGTFNLRNCVIVTNVAALGNGAGLYTGAGGVLYATNCVIRKNRAGAGLGGGVYHAGTACVLDGCEISANVGTDRGGGVNAGAAGLVLRNCRIWGNTGLTAGGGVHLPLAGSSLENCVIVSNRATGGNGAGATVAAGSSIRNCLVAYNTAAGVAGGVDLSGTMRSCTVASNTASILVGGVRGAAVGSVVLNSIVYHNKAGSRLNHNEAGENAVWTNCCTTPDLVSKGVGCKYADPKFVDRGAGNFRLDGASPCIDAGRYESWMSAAVDLDKRPRLQRGAVDMGAYELPPAGTAIVLY